MSARSRRPHWDAVLPGVVLVLLAVGVGAGVHVHSAVAPPRTTLPLPSPSHAMQASSEAMPSTDPRPPRDTANHHLLAWLFGTVLVLFVLMVAMAIVRLMVNAVRAHKAGPPPAEIDDEAPLAPLAEQFTEQARETFAEALHRLAAGDDVDAAIIECWRRLEDAAAARGVAREPTQTSTEYTSTLLASTDADPADLRTLAGLYQRAMFGGVRASQADRDEAIGALSRLGTALSGVHMPAGVASGPLVPTPAGSSDAGAGQSGAVS